MTQNADAQESGQRVILVTGRNVVPPEACHLIERRGFIVKVVEDDLNDAELHNALAGVSGYLIGGEEKPKSDHFERACDLEAAAFVGTDFRGHVPGWKRAFKLGIAFISTPGENALSVAEFTILLMLSLARPLTAHLITNSELVQYGEADNLSMPPQVELQGRTLGIIGAGRIGSRVARIAAQGFEMNVVYTSSQRNVQLETESQSKRVGKETLLEKADVVSLHRPAPGRGEQATIGKAELELMKPGALLINAADSRLVDPKALASAIESKSVRAAFDGIGKGRQWGRLVAFGPQRFLCTEQTGFRTRDASLRAGMRAAEAVCDVLAGKTSASVNNPDFRERNVARRSSDLESGI
jgi:phosphoglycerate dehydrogenase-like enzyme